MISNTPRDTSNCLHTSGQHPDPCSRSESSRYNRKEQGRRQTASLGPPVQAGSLQGRLSSYRVQRHRWEQTGLVLQGAVGKAKLSAWQRGAPHAAVQPAQQLSPDCLSNPCFHSGPESKAEQAEKAPRPSCSWERRNFPFFYTSLLAENHWEKP